MAKPENVVLNQGYDATWLRREIWFAVLSVFPEGASKKSFSLTDHARKDMSPEEKAASEEEQRRILATVKRIEGIIEQIGVKPERSAMVAEHIPAVNVAENNTVFFTQGDYPHLLVEPQPYAIDLHPRVRQFLDTTAPGWSVVYDRGDWGEGLAHVTVTVPFQRQCALFLDRFGERKPKGFTLDDPPSPANQ